MATITKIDNLSKELKKNYKRKDEIVLLPLSKYNELIERLEELEDMQDHIQAMKDYRAGKGRSFREFLDEHKKEFKI